MIRVAAFAVALIFLILTLILFPTISVAGDLGLCLPSPNQWLLPRFPGWLLNALLIFLSASLIDSANKKYNFVQEGDPLVAIVLLLLLCLNCISTATLSTSSLLLFCNVLCLYIIFSTYEETNATREFFLIATFPAIGAMTQYAFLVMIPVYIAGGLMMKSFRIRELIAFIFGLLAPYWIAMGLGIVSPLQFRLPDSLAVFNAASVENDIFISLLAVGAMSVIGIILALYNGVKLFTRNSRLRCMHTTFNIMGFVSVLAVIFDFNNFVAYTGTIALWVAVETATLLSLYRLRQPGVALGILLLIFLPLYILAL